MPIGHPSDITLRALESFRDANLIFVEDPSTVSRLFKKWDVPFIRERIRVLNEHTTADELNDLVREAANVELSVVVSDAGMPVFCDPGGDFMRLCEKAGIRIEIVPGPTALTSALVRAGINGAFYFAGFPPRKSEERGGFFRKLNQMTVPIVLYETPYRLEKILGEIQRHFRPDKKVIVCAGLTSPDESIVTSTVANAGKIRIQSAPPVTIIDG